MQFWFVVSSDLATCVKLRFGAVTEPNQTEGSLCLYYNSSRNTTLL